MPKSSGRHIPVISDSAPVSRDTELVRKALTKKEFGNRLYKLAIVDRGWTQAELARRADVLPDSISNYVRGLILPDVPNLNKLAKALGMDSADLLPNIDAQAIRNEVSPAFEIRSSKDNPERQWVKMDREVSAATAIKIQQALIEDTTAAKRK